jgi:hypothetical protein
VDAAATDDLDCAFDNFDFNGDFDPVAVDDFFEERDDDDDGDLDGDLADFGDFEGGVISALCSSPSVGSSSSSSSVSYSPSASASASFTFASPSVSVISITTSG